MKGERDQVLQAIEPGDVLFARASDGSPKVLFVYRATDETIYVRLVTSQTKMTFDRKGKSTFVDGNYTCKITSAAPLQAHEYNIVLGLDRKMRLSHWASDVRLTDDEKRLLLTIDDFYDARLLPDD